MRLRIFGVEISASFWFFALIFCILLLDRAVLALYFVLPIAVHELGHLLTMAVFRVAVQEIRLSALGIAIRREAVVLPYGRELAICFGGVFANALFAFGLYLFCFQSIWVMLLIAANIAIAAFNLLPIGDLDGGQIVRLLAERFFLPDTARVISLAASLLVLALLFGLTVFFLLIRCYNPTLLITCLYFAFNVIARD